MKKTLISLAAASLVASSAFAADKGIDIVVGGQAALYYETHDMNGYGANTSLFDQDDSIANVGIQLDLGADLGNNFTFGAQATYLGTAGLEKNLVGNVSQTASNTVLVNSNDTTDEFALTKIFLAKQIGNTTLKIGRQELPMSLSPLAYSEGWNVYKNTFDAIVVINADIPKTTLVGAYVAGGTNVGGLGMTGDLQAISTLGALDVDDTAYMITASTTAIPMTTVTASYYHLSQVADDLLSAAQTSPTTYGVSADAMWLDVAIADKSFPLGLAIGLQAGNIDPDGLAPSQALALGDLDDTTAYGVKVSLAPMEALSLTVAYNDVDGSSLTKNYVAVHNTAAGSDDTPLFTQMNYNARAISLDAETIMVKAGYSFGDMGAISVAYGMTDAGRNNLVGLNTAGTDGADYNEFNLEYSVSMGGVDYYAGYYNRDIDQGGVVGTTGGNTLNSTTDDDIIRVVARYNF